MNTSFAQFRIPLPTGKPRGAGWVLWLVLLLVAIGLLPACATLPPPTAELGAAQQALDRAADADADQYAADEISAARSELAQAQAAMAGRRNADARGLALSAAAAADLAYARSQATTAYQQYRLRREQIAGLRQQLGDSTASAPELSPPADGMDGQATPAQRLQALDANPRLAGLAETERLQARQAVQAVEAASRSQAMAATVLAARRVASAELAAQGALIAQASDRLERTRNTLLVEASRREAERARREAERLRIQAQIQAEEMQRLRAQAQAEAQARQQAEDVIIDVGGKQAAKLKAARAREAELARQEAELRKAREAVSGSDDGQSPR